MNDRPLSDAADTARPSDRRGGDRRTRTLRALLVGSFRPRRRKPRRTDERDLASLDWHPARWLGVSVAIVLLSVADAFFTLTLIELGAEELNPFMEPLVMGSAQGFAIWKLALTSIGVITLAWLARIKAFGRVPVGSILCAVLAAYIVLLGYELWLLEHLSSSAYQP